MQSTDGTLSVIYDMTDKIYLSENFRYDMTRCDPYLLIRHSHLGKLPFTCLTLSPKIKCKLRSSGGPRIQPTRGGAAQERPSHPQPYFRRKKNPETLNHCEHKQCWHVAGEGGKDETDSLPGNFWPMIKPKLSY